MSQPVKLSDALILDARLAAEVQERSIAGQVEFWAKLGQSIDHLLKGPQVQALRQAGRKESLSQRLASVDTPAGRARVEAYLETRPYPHFRESGQPGMLVRTDEDGTETTGRFVNRVFVPVNNSARMAESAVAVGASQAASVRVNRGARERAKAIPAATVSTVRSKAKQGRS
jgi:hypothetical protein